MAATMIVAIEGYVCETWSEYTRLLVVFELVLLCLAGAGAENEFHFTVSETSGPVVGVGAENELPDHETDVASRGQCGGMPTLLGLGVLFFFRRQRKKKVLSGDFLE